MTAAMAEALYEDAGGRCVFTHAFIAEGYRGWGLSGVLMRGVLEDVEQRHITVTNRCPVLDRFIDKNPGYAPLIDSGNPGNWPKCGRNALGATRM
jgi:predicted GNAT family acetyltransferase